MSTPVDGGRSEGDRVESDRAAAELDRLRDRIDELDRRIVELLNERAALGRAIGRAKATVGRRDVRDAERERAVLLRVAMANEGPLAQSELLAVYRRVIAATRDVERRDRDAERLDDGDGGPEDG